MTPENDRVLSRLRVRLERIATSDEGDVGALLDDVQSALQQTLDLFERDPAVTGIADAVHDAEAEVETIRFTRATDVQRDAASAVIAQLLLTLPRP